MSKIKVYSFGHPISDGVKMEMHGRYPDDGIEFISVPFTLDMKRNTMEQIAKIIEFVFRETNGAAPFIILPGLSVGSALVIVMLLGRLGRFPLLIELTKNAKKRWEWRIKDIHDLDAVRNMARMLR